MLLRWVYALKVNFNLTAPALHFQCAVPTRVLLVVSVCFARFARLRQTGGAALLCFRRGLRLLRCVLQGLLHVANQFVGFVVAAFGQDRIKNAGEFAA